jgi:hypothetical protein
MSDETMSGDATSRQLKKTMVEDMIWREFGPPPELDPESRAKWVLHCLERKYRQMAQPFIDELIQIEKQKPPRPIILTNFWKDAEDRGNE